jgi:hypothetical protein
MRHDSLVTKTKYLQFILYLMCLILVVKTPRIYFVWKFVFFVIYYCNDICDS